MVRPLAPISLTFDDGPHAGTQEILRILGSYGVTATFFQCGMHARRNPEISLAVASKHEVANHTESHPLLLRCLPGVIAREVAQAQEAIEHAAGVAPRLFRCPYGVPGLGLGAALRPHGLRNVFWTVIGNDWKWPADRIAERVLARTRPGGIIVLHDGRDVDPTPDISHTIEAVRRIVPELLERGFEFKTASQLLCRTT